MNIKYANERCTSGLIHVAYVTLRCTSGLQLVLTPYISKQTEPTRLFAHSLPNLLSTVLDDATTQHADTVWSTNNQINGKTKPCCGLREIA
jgi:hypothetical protein